MSSERRYNTRHGARRRAKPNPALYVGYVEDSETVGMIMKKFEALDRIEQEKKASRRAKVETLNPAQRKEELSDDDDVVMADANDGALNEDDLANVFQQTSIFSVQSAQHNNVLFFDAPVVANGFVTQLQEPDFEALPQMCDYDVTAEDQYYSRYGDVNESDFFSDPETKKSKKGRQRSKQSKSGPKGKKTSQVRFDFGVSVGGVEKHKLKRRPASDEHYTKIPPHPIPKSWAHRIKPYEVEPDIPPTRCAKLSANLCSFDTTTLPEQDYLGCYLNLKWNSDTDTNRGDITIDHFKTLGLPNLVSRGLLFVWVPKDMTYLVTIACEEMSFRFVESMTWIKKHVNNRICQRPSRYFNSSKANLLLFRKCKPGKNDYFRLDLRHQRTSDSHFGFVRYDPDTGDELKPDDYVFQLIETLLPPPKDDSVYKVGEQRYLYLGAPRCSPKRDGWTLVTDQRV